MKNLRPVSIFMLWLFVITKAESKINYESKVIYNQEYYNMSKILFIKRNILFEPKTNSNAIKFNELIKYIIIRIYSLYLKIMEVIKLIKCIIDMYSKLSDIYSKIMELIKLIKWIKTNLNNIRFIELINILLVYIRELVI